MREDGRAAVVEMATASGLSRVAPAERDAKRATSAGTGDLLTARCSTPGSATWSLGIGGSATTDGGAGLLRALGAAIAEDDGHGVPAVDLAGLDPRLGTRSACGSPAT